MDGLVQGRHNSSVLAMPCTKPSMSFDWPFLETHKQVVNASKMKFPVLKKITYMESRLI